MLDLKKLEAEQERASEDKADLFDFYHKNWSAILRELRNYQSLSDNLHDAGIENDFNKP